MRTWKRTTALAIGLVAVLAMSATACQRPTTAKPPPTPAQAGHVKIRYGPFTVPGANSPATGPFAAIAPMLGAAAENGMVWNLPVKDVQQPCKDCFITKIGAGLEYQDGKDANIDTGLWLHHMVALSQGTGRSDPTCGAAGFSLPHVAVGASPANAERFFASGNERTELSPDPAAHVGYKVNSGDRWHLIMELMNQNIQAKQVWFTMTYDYVPGTTPGMRGVKPIWLDAAQCGTSEVKAKAGAYKVQSVPWKSTVAGPIVGAGGHVHDGGTHVTIEKNGKSFCDGETKYGTKPAYVSGGGGMDGMDHGDGGGHGGGQHVSEQEICLANPVTTLAMGDTLTVTGWYDDAQHPQMVHEGKLHSVMAIAVLYVAQ
jgi:hypothetical protein